MNADDLAPIRDKMEAWWLLYFDTPLRDVAALSDPMERGSYIGFLLGRMLAIADNTVGQDGVDLLIQTARLAAKESKATPS